MGDNLPALPVETSLALDPSISAQLQTPEDYKLFGQKFIAGQTALSWWLADLVADCRRKFDKDTAIELGTDLGLASSTIMSYIRVSKAFAPDQRIGTLSFSHHFTAAFADTYNDETGEFEGDNRFNFLEKALDQGLSTRELKAQIDHDKKLHELQRETIPCDWCSSDEGTIDPYTLFCSQQIPHRAPDKFDFHNECYLDLMRTIKSHGQN